MGMLSDFSLVVPAAKHKQRFLPDKLCDEMNVRTESLVVSAATYSDFNYDLMVYVFLLKLCFCGPSFRDGFLPACCRDENIQVGSVTEGYQV